jgi:hypothetical protein
MTERCHVHVLLRRNHLLQRARSEVAVDLDRHYPHYSALRHLYLSPPLGATKLQGTYSWPHMSTMYTAFNPLYFFFRTKARAQRRNTPQRNDTALVHLDSLESVAKLIISCVELPHTQSALEKQRVYSE